PHWMKGTSFSVAFQRTCPSARSQQGSVYASDGEKVRMGLRFQFSRAVGLMVLVLAGALSAGASDDLLQPQTKLRVTVVQWNPAKGDYQAWQAIGGEFAVSQTGTLGLRVIGQAEAAARAATAVADPSSIRLQKRMGLLEKPETTGEILEYPPI